MIHEYCVIICMQACDRAAKALSMVHAIQSTLAPLRPATSLLTLINSPLGSPRALAAAYKEDDLSETMASMMTTILLAHRGGQDSDRTGPGASSVRRATDRQWQSRVEAAEHEYRQKEVLGRLLLHQLQVLGTASQRTLEALDTAEYADKWRAALAEARMDAAKAKAAATGAGDEAMQAAEDNDDLQKKMHGVRALGRRQEVAELELQAAAKLVDASGAGVKAAWLTRESQHQEVKIKRIEMLVSVILYGSSTVTDPCCDTIAWVVRISLLTKPWHVDVPLWPRCIS